MKLVSTFLKKEIVRMKAARVLAFVLLGIGAITGAVVFAQAPTAQPGLSPVPMQPNHAPPGYVIESVGQNGRVYWMNTQDQSAQLVHDYVKAEKDDEKKEIRKKLADALSKQFDAHMEQQQKELTALEKQIADLRAILKKRQDAKTDIIDRRMDQLIRDAEGLGWTAPGNPNQPRVLWGQGAPSYRPADSVPVNRLPVRNETPVETKKDEKKAP
jgi:hypothetical protein